MTVSSELAAVLRPHVEAAKVFINGCVEYDSFPEYLEAVEDAGGKAVQAVKSIQWILGADLDDSIKEQLAYGPVRAIESYPWIADGFRWAATQIAKEGIAA